MLTIAKERNSVMFAFVQNGEIKEHSVTTEMIKARGVSQDLFVACVVSEKPKVEAWENIKTNLSFENGVVKVDFQAVNKEVDSLLQDYANVIHRKSNQEKLPGLTYLESISNLYRLLVRNELSGFLNKYAKEQGYTNFEKLISYAQSTNPLYRQQAQAGLETRDVLYLGFDEHFKQVYRMRRPPALTFKILFGEVMAMVEELSQSV